MVSSDIQNCLEFLELNTQPSEQAVVHCAPNITKQSETLSDGWEFIIIEFFDWACVGAFDLEM